MAVYRVAFDGKWQEDFDDQEEALAWAREVGETGRIAYVVAFGGPLRRWIASPKLVAVFPESRAEEGTDRWKRGVDGGGSLGVPPFRPAPGSKPPGCGSRALTIRSRASSPFTPAPQPRIDAWNRGWMSGRTRR
jgi:hypothetical protein